MRLKSAYIIKCTGIKKDSDGNVEEIYCEYDPDTRSGMPGSMRKVKGTLHWVSAEYSSTAEVRLYDRLFNVENPAEEKDVDFRELLNPDSLKSSIIAVSSLTWPRMPSPAIDINSSVQDIFVWTRIRPMGIWCSIGPYL